MTGLQETPKFGRFFLPGPTEVHPDVLKAQSQPMIPHRGSAMEGLLSGMVHPMKQLFQTEANLLLGTCAATGFMEMAARCGVRHRVLSLVGGAFGERFAAMAAACGCDVTRLNVPLGETVEPDMVREAVQRSEPDAVTICHSETATGALAPLKEIAAVVNEFDDVLVLVDGVTSVAASPLYPDEWGLDFVFTGTQKALALPPGLALGMASDRMIERARTIPERGGYFDVVVHAKAFKKAQPTNTPGISTLFALAKQFERIEAEGGIEARWERHRRMRELVEKWIDGRGGELGFSFLPVAGRRSATVSCLNVARSANARSIVLGLRKRGWIIGTGYGDLREQTIRIGHMGDHSVSEVEELLEEVEKVVS